MPSRLAYVSFDSVPSPKGASTHIEAFARTLAVAFGGIDLVTVSPDVEPTPPVERWPGVAHTELPATGRSLIDRVLCFRHHLSRWVRARWFDTIQFRSIFEGLPLLPLRGRTRLVFEINGLPSVELKYRYPAVVDDRELMRKIVAQEEACCRAADLIITPSRVTRKFLVSQRGAESVKIRVVPNGVDLDVFTASPRENRAGCRLLYFGTLAAWQGVELAIRALPQIPDAMLTIIGSGSARQRETLANLAAKLGVHVVILSPLSQQELVRHIHAAAAVLAPLTLNDRNVEQGCCPLKILEAMAAGTPVIASDLPVVRELGRDGEHFLLVKPGSVDQIAEAVNRLNADRELAAQMGQQSREHVEANYSWSRAGAALASAYGELASNRA